MASWHRANLADYFAGQLDQHRGSHDVNFSSFPLSFFGSDTSEKVIKANLLQFFLHGPGTGSIALTAILIFNPAIKVLGLRGNEFMPFAVVTMILMWQWGVSIVLPYLNQWLVYGRKQDEAHNQLYSLSESIVATPRTSQPAHDFIAVYL
ncbi:MAG UNVERIFIED_CONTAM: hypothetical protein LVT10_01470 [Anaerolineae bacterium]